MAEELRVSPGHAEALAWTREQLRRFLAHAAATADRLEALWLLVATTGLRRGEALALTWDDLVIHRDAGERVAGRLTVHRAITVVHNAPVATQAKTRAGRRTIALDPATVAALNRHRGRQRAERAAAAEAWQEHGLVFCREDGTALHPSAASRRFKVLSKQAGLPPLSLHGLRHTYATVALRSGVPTKVVAGRLGHASPQITDLIYAHVLPGMDDEAALRAAAEIVGSADDDPDDKTSGEAPGEGK